MRINGISSPAGAFATPKNAAANTAFRGVYLINGTNAEINKTIKHLKHAKQDCSSISYDKLNEDAYSDALLSYVLVTTGKDAAIYNDYINKNENPYRESVLPVLDRPVEDDFETQRDYENHRRASDTVDILETIFKSCKFSTSVHNVSAKKVLPAMKEGKFDYKEGKIKTRG